MIAYDEIGEEARRSLRDDYLWHELCGWVGERVAVVCGIFVNTICSVKTSGVVVTWIRDGRW
jgi:hypothetical protein